MTAHDHREYVEGCFRCEIGRDEADRGDGYAAPLAHVVLKRAADVQHGDWFQLPDFSWVAVSNITQRDGNQVTLWLDNGSDWTGPRYVVMAVGVAS